MGRSTPNQTSWAIASVFFVLATPFLVQGGCWLQHVLSYHGECGPHAPDIAAHPCSYATYEAEFAAGFAGVGLLLIEAAAFVVAGAIVLTAWLIVIARQHRR